MAFLVLDKLTKHFGSDAAADRAYGLERLLVGRTGNGR